MKRVVGTYNGWVINTRSLEGHGLIGRFWFGEQPIPDKLLGHKPCCFATRAEARKYLKRVKPSFPRAIVENVKVEMIAT